MMLVKILRVVGLYEEGLCFFVLFWGMKGIWKEALVLGRDDLM